MSMLGYMAPTIAQDFSFVSRATQEGSTRDVAGWIAAAGDAVTKAIIALRTPKAALGPGSGAFQTILVPAAPQPGSPSYTGGTQPLIPENLKTPLLIGAVVLAAVLLLPKL